MFASNVNRVQQVADCAISYGRKVCFIGRSMINVSTVAMELGYSSSRGKASWKWTIWAITVMTRYLSLPRVRRESP